MKYRSLLFFLVGLLGLVLAPVWASNEQCLRCHTDTIEKTPVRAHQNCMRCHSEGAEAHIARFRVPPAPVADETCTMCHRANEAFVAISAHNQGLECSACHLMHEP